MNITLLIFMTTFHNFAPRIQTGCATTVLKHNGTCLTITWGKMSQPIKSRSWKKKVWNFTKLHFMCILL